MVSRVGGGWLVRRFAVGERVHPGKGGAGWRFHLHGPQLHLYRKSRYTQRSWNEARCRDDGHYPVLSSRDDRDGVVGKLWANLSFVLAPGLEMCDGVRPGGLGLLTSPEALTLIASFVLALVFD